MLSKGKFNHRVLMLAVLIVFSVLNLFIVVVNHYNFRTFAFDLAAYNFAFFDFAHFKISPSPLYFMDYIYPITFLQDHFSFTLIILSPLYWLMAWATGSYTLLVIQWLFIVLGAWTTYKLIALKSNNYKLALLALIYYFVLFGRYSSADADCNLAVIGAATIPVFLYFFETKKMWATALTFLFLVFNREDYALWLIFVSLFLVLLHRKDKQQRRLAMAYLAASVIFLVLMFKVFIPALEDDYKKYTLFEFKVLGTTPAEAFMFIIQHPLKTVKLLFINFSGDAANDLVKPEFFIVYLLSGGALLLFRPLYIIPFIPLIAKKMFADSPIRWSAEAYYSVEVVSILPVLVFMLLADLKGTTLKYSAGSFICLITAAVTVYKFNSVPKLPYYDASKYDFTKPAFYKCTYDRNEIHAAMQQIPDSAIVCASDRIAPHMAFRKRIYCYPKISDAQYILILKHGDEYPMGLEEFKTSVANLRVDIDFTLLKEGNDILLFKLDKKYLRKGN